MPRAIATASEADSPTEIAMTAIRVTRSTTRRACMAAISALPRLRARVGSTGVLARNNFSSGTCRARCALGGLEWWDFALLFRGVTVPARVSGHDVDAWRNEAIRVALSSSTGGSGEVAGCAEGWPGRKIRASIPSTVRGMGSSLRQGRGWFRDVSPPRAPDRFSAI